MEIRQLLQLKANGHSNRSCSTLLSINRNTINNYVQLLKACDQGYEALLKISDLALRELFPQADTKDIVRYKTLMEYLPEVFEDRNSPGFTLRYSWECYRANNPVGYGFTQFAFHYNRLYKKPKQSLPLQHKAGEKIYVDYAGKKAKITNRETGEITEVEMFVAVLPFSNYTYAEASYSQKKEDFIGSMNRCLSFFGGTPTAIVSDNLKSAVSKSCKYEPIINKTFKSFGVHYNTVIAPARPYKPKDKALVEGAVKLIYQRILFPLRKMKFFSLAELNKHIQLKLEQHNRTNFQDKKCSRLDLFTKSEKRFLKPLPAQKFEMREYKRLQVNLSGHVKLSPDNHYYSVPCEHIGKKVEMQYSQDFVEIYKSHKRIASHKRIKTTGYSTRSEHLSKSNQEYSKWNEDYFIEKATGIGDYTKLFTSKLIRSKQYPPQAYKQAHGIIMLKRLYANNRIEMACRISLATKKYSYHAVAQILKKGIDFNHRELFGEDQPSAASHIPKHENERGNQYC